MDKIKTRFAPSPTGWLHIGGARTALFNFLLARKMRGIFLLRIEDTDRTRHDESAVGKIIDDLRWLGIQWDEGIEVGGPNGPYRQSERLEIYREYVNRLIQDGLAYYAFDTPEELEQMRARARAEKRDFRYPRPSEFPTPEDVKKARAEGKPVVVRFKTPQRDVTIHDEVFGEVTVSSNVQDDFIILKDDGWPTYHLANVVDDGLMGVNFIMRGQEFLSQTWRHVQLREALGFPEPRYAHLPLIMDMSGKKLSKRTGAVEVHAFRTAGYLPEALINFIALLGWTPGGDKEKFTLDELIEYFSIERINKANAKFDSDKLLAFNTAAIAEAPEDRLLEAFKDFLSLNDTPIPADDDELLKYLLRINKGFRTFTDIVNKCAVLFMKDDEFEYDQKAVKKVLAANDGAGFSILAELREKLAQCEWNQQELQRLIEGMCEEKSVGMGKIAQPIRVAVTGKTVSPAIYDTLMILGKEKTLARIERCLKMHSR
ncbi:MAG: glutamate--tRNA ligase [Planctomycetes bacterium]|nr:glutamate--tRNA ligase [Planctomycetota bacterium]